MAVSSAANRQARTHHRPVTRRSRALVSLRKAIAQATETGPVGELLSDLQKLEASLAADPADAPEGADAMVDTLEELRKNRYRP